MFRLGIQISCCGGALALYNFTRLENLMFNLIIEDGQISEQGL